MLTLLWRLWKIPTYKGQNPLEVLDYTKYNRYMACYISHVTYKVICNAYIILKTELSCCLQVLSTTSMSYLHESLSFSAGGFVSFPFWGFVGFSSTTSPSSSLPSGSLGASGWNPPPFLGFLSLEVKNRYCSMSNKINYFYVLWTCPFLFQKHPLLISSRTGWPWETEHSFDSPD